MPWLLVELAVGEALVTIRLHPPLRLLGLSIAMAMGAQQQSRRRPGRTVGPTRTTRSTALTAARSFWAGWPHAAARTATALQPAHDENTPLDAASER